MRGGFTIVFGFAVSLLPTMAWAAPADADLGELAGLVELFPQSRTLPPPPWLQPGVRVSYSGASASFNGGGAAASLSQYDVVAADGEQISVYLHAYGDLGTGVIPLGAAAVIGYPGIGPFWINPTVLDDAESFSGGTLTVTRFDKGGGQVVVRFQTQTTNGQTVVEIDAATGALVFSSISSPGSASQLEQLGTRAVPLPWAADRSPNWVRTGATLEYAGTRATTIPGSGTVNQAFGNTVVVSDAGARWSVMDASAVLDGMGLGMARTFNGGAQMFGSFWIPRSALPTALATTETLIDADPFSGAQTFAVSQPNGSVVLRQTTAASQTVLGYDAQFGALVQYEQQVDYGTSFVVDTLSLSGGSDLGALSMEPELPDDPPFPDGDSGGDTSGGTGDTAGTGDDTGGDDNDDGEDAGDSDDGEDTDGDTEGSAADDDDAGGGCSTGGATGPSGMGLLLLLGLEWRRRRSA